MTEGVQQKRSSLSLPAGGAIVGFVTYVVAIRAGEIFDLNSDSDNGTSTAAWIASFVIAAVILGIVLVVLRRVLAGGAGTMATASLVFGVLALVGIVVFWASPPLTLGGTAIGLALAVRQETGQLGGKTITGAALGLVGFVSGVAACLFG